MQNIGPYIEHIFFSIPEFFRYMLVFITSVIEGMPVVGTFLPGGTIAVIVGGLSAEGFVNPIITVFIIAIGTFFGDMIGFLIGRKYKDTPWVKKLIFKEKHQKHWDLFDRHVALVVIFGKLLPVIRSTPSLFAAVRGVVIKKYIMYSAIGSLLWAVVGIYAGNILGKILGDNLMIFIICIIGATVVYMFGKKVYSAIRRRIS